MTQLLMVEIEIPVEVGRFLPFTRVLYIQTVGFLSLGFLIPIPLEWSRGCWLQAHVLVDFQENPFRQRWVGGSWISGNLEI